MRVVFIALVLSLCAPQVPLGARDLPVPDPAGSVAFGTAAPASAHLIRAVVKGEKTFGGSWLSAPPRVTWHSPRSDRAQAGARASEQRHLALDVPPLAPRPPPLS
jgi:hypothetical protein